MSHTIDFRFAWSVLLATLFVAVAIMIASTSLVAQPIVGDNAPKENQDRNLADPETDADTQAIAAGKQEFANCRARHADASGPQHSIGPSLIGISSRRVGSLVGYAYSKAMSRSRLKWSDDNLNKFLKDPNDFLTGNKMAFSGIVSEGKRKNLIAYLKSLQ